MGAGLTVFGHNDNLATSLSQGVEQARRLLDDLAFVTAHNDDGVRCENLAEVIALLVAEARDAGADETLLAEIMLRTISSIERRCSNPGWFSPRWATSRSASS